MKTIKIMTIILLAFLLFVLANYHNRQMYPNIQTDEGGNGSAVEQCPWETGGKKPDSYTWEEFTSLSELQQERFAEWFASQDLFEAWMNDAQMSNTVEDLPWTNGGKRPDEYTWEEFQALEDMQQEKFFEWFGTPEDFEMWMELAQRDAVYGDLPWMNGGKCPDTYTWAEFEALSDIQQEKFVEWFETQEDFENWMNAANPCA